MSKVSLLTVNKVTTSSTLVLQLCQILLLLLNNHNSHNSHNNNHNNNSLYLFNSRLLGRYNRPLSNHPCNNNHNLPLHFHSHNRPHPNSSSPLRHNLLCSSNNLRLSCVSNHNSNHNSSSSSSNRHRSSSHHSSSNSNPVLLLRLLPWNLVVRAQASETRIGICNLKHS